MAIGQKSQKGPHIQISKMCYMGWIMVYFHSRIVISSRKNHNNIWLWTWDIFFTALIYRINFSSKYIKTITVFWTQKKYSCIHKKDTKVPKKSMLTLKLFKKIYEISLKVHNKLFRSSPDRPPGLCNNRHVLVINVLFMEPRQYQKHNEVPGDKKIMYLHNLQKN